MNGLLDSNEHTKHPELQAELTKVLGIAIDIASLGKSCGDFWVYLETGILIAERKTLDDLVASLADGRLFQQSEHIPKLCRFPFLVIDGEVRYSAADKDGNQFLMAVRQNGWGQTGWRKSAIEAALIRVQLNGMCLVRDAESYPEALKQIIAQCERADIPHTNRGKTRTANPFDDGTQETVDWLATLPGIDTAKAVSLVEFFERDLKEKTMTRLDLLAWILNHDGKEAIDHKNPKPALWGPLTHSRIREFLGMRTGQWLKVESKTEWVEAV